MIHFLIIKLQLTKKVVPIFLGKYNKSDSSFYYYL